MLLLSAQDPLPGIMKAFSRAGVARVPRQLVARHAANPRSLRPSLDEQWLTPRHAQCRRCCIPTMLGV